MQWTLHRQSWKAFCKKSNGYKHEISEESPPFTEIELPYAWTRLTPSGYKMTILVFYANKIKLVVLRVKKEVERIKEKHRSRVWIRTKSEATHHNLKQFSLNTKWKTNDNQFEVRLSRAVVLFCSTHLKLIQE